MRRGMLPSRCEWKVLESRSSTITFLTDHRNSDFFSFKLDLEVKDVEHMRTIIAALQANNFVERVERANTG